MLFHKSNIMKTILVILLFSVAIITAADDNNDARPSENDPTISSDDPGDGHSEIGDSNGSDDQNANQFITYYIARDVDPEDLESDPLSKPFQFYAFAREANHL